MRQYDFKNEGDIAESFLKVHNAEWYAFNPCIIEVTDNTDESEKMYGELKRIVVDIYKGNTSIASVTAEARGGKAVLDVSPFLQQEFDIDAYLENFDSHPSSVQTCNGVWKADGIVLDDISYDIHAYYDYNNEEVEIGTDDLVYSTFYWAALGAQEKFTPYRNCKLFRDKDDVTLPFVVGLWRPVVSCMIVEGQQVCSGRQWRTISMGVPTINNVITTQPQGLYNFLGCSADIIVQSKEPQVGQETTDWVTQFSVTEETITSEKYAYLRWIDDSGFIRYWAFNIAEDAHKTTTTDVQSNGALVYNASAYEVSNFITGRTANVTRDDTIKCVYSNASADDADLLMTIIDSPAVQLMTDRTANNGCGSWVRVVVQGATYKEPKKHLQDFELTIVLPKKPLQRV